MDWPATPPLSPFHFMPQLHHVASHMKKIKEREKKESAKGAQMYLLGSALRERGKGLRRKEDLASYFLPRYTTLLYPLMPITLTSLLTILLSSDQYMNMKRRKTKKKCHFSLTSHRPFDRPRFAATNYCCCCWLAVPPSRKKSATSSFRDLVSPCDGGGGGGGCPFPTSLPHPPPPPLSFSARGRSTYRVECMDGYMPPFGGGGGFLLLFSVSSSLRS